MCTSSSLIDIVSGREAVAAVVSLQMRYDKFYELFMTSTELCPNRHGPCNLTCKSDVRLSGFVLTSLNNFMNKLECNKSWSSDRPVNLKYDL